MDTSFAHRMPLISWASLMRRRWASTKWLVLSSTMVTWSSSRSSVRSRLSLMAQRVGIECYLKVHSLRKVLRSLTISVTCCIINCKTIFRCWQGCLLVGSKLCWHAEGSVLSQSEGRKWVCHQGTDCASGKQDILVSVSSTNLQVIFMLKSISQISTTKVIQQRLYQEKYNWKMCLSLLVYNIRCSLIFSSKLIECERFFVS